MDITLPAIPAGVLVLLALVAPYVQALIQRPQWPSKWKKVISVGVALVLTGVVLAFYYWYTGDTIPAWPVLILLAVVVAQASYTLVTKSTAATVEERTSPPVPVVWSAEERATQDLRDADVDRFNTDHP